MYKKSSFVNERFSALRFFLFFSFFLFSFFLIFSLFVADILLFPSFFLFIPSFGERSGNPSIDGRDAEKQKTNKRHQLLFLLLLPLLVVLEIMTEADALYSFIQKHYLFTLHFC